ncbi:aspartate aminotransferase family protein [Nitrincola schmidtii]|uniref:aspartate aminotransferase family protein n=1 Tax=Nitrincola schmidtii TaxID=1730894 RepID=UPI00197F1DA4|nr:aspartate aminotransferase family protein [Nitrincola schmidtii]
MADHAELIQRRQRLLGKSYRLFYQNPLYPVKGEGVWLYEADGKRYLDAYNNVVSVGHCHPKVVEAICAQASQLNTHTRYLHDSILNYAERLLVRYPAHLNNLTMTCSGSEANDLALRIAREVTGNPIALITRWAYHGTTSSIAEISPSLGIDIGKDVRILDAPDTFRNKGKWLASLRQTLDELSVQGLNPAALIMDGVFSSDGIFIPPAEEIQQAVEWVRQAGGIYIADEVQSGFARTGNHFWGFEAYQVKPDMVTIGKPMGNGHPVAGLVARSDLLDQFGEKQRYFNTFGGNPVSCAAANAVLDVIEDEQLQMNAQRQGQRLRYNLDKLAGRYHCIADIRGSGLFYGIELVKDRESLAPASELASMVVNAMREAGVLISATGPDANVLKIRPPLVFAEEHVDLLTDTLDKVLLRFEGCY